MDEYSKGLEDAAIAAAKTPGIPVSIAYAAAREIWTLWWERQPIREHHEKEDPEMVKNFFRNYAALALMTGFTIGRAHPDYRDPDDVVVTVFYDNIWREWVGRSETDSFKQFWFKEADRFIAGGRGERIL